MKDANAITPKIMIKNGTGINKEASIDNINAPQVIKFKVLTFSSTSFNVSAFAETILPLVVATVDACLYIVSLSSLYL